MTFLGVETHNFTKHLLKMHKFQSRENLSRDSISGPASLEAPRHRCSWHPPWHLLRAGALQPRRGHFAPRRGAACHLNWFPGPRQPRCQQPWTTKVVGMLSSTRSTDKRTMNILDLKRNTFTNTSNKFQGIIFYNSTFAELMCQSFFNEASKDNVISANL